MNNKIKETRWYPYAVASCIAVFFYVFLIRFSSVISVVRTFAGYFRPVVLGCVIAYIINPLSNLFRRTLFKTVKKEKSKNVLSNSVAIAAVLVLIIGIIMILLPQIIGSIETFIHNMDDYVANTTEIIEESALANTQLDISAIISSSENLLDIVSGYVKENMQEILKQTISTGKNLFQWVIAFILSAYLLSEKHKLKEGLKRLLKAVFGRNRYEKMAVYLHHCDFIFNRYIVFNLIDAAIVGCVNALFMTIMGMPYVGLISVVVGVTNLIPTFGPIIGGAIGAFVLLLLKPIDALVFLIFTVILQFLDGYVIKPKLFGNSLGVSGLWILAGVIVGGNMFGVLGILLAIPVVTIIDYTYREYFLPWLEAKNQDGQDL